MFKQYTCECVYQFSALKKETSQCTFLIIEVGGQFDSGAFPLSLCLATDTTNKWAN